MQASASVDGNIKYIGDPVGVVCWAVREGVLNEVVYSEQEFTGR